MKRWLSIVALALTACGGERAFAPCDVRDVTCRESIARATQQLRGSSGPLPDVVLRTEDELIAEDVSETTEEQRERFARDNTALALLDLAPPGLELADASASRYARVAAFYSSATKAVTIVDRGASAASPEMTVLLTHELVHALQDQDGWMERVLVDRPPGLDAQLARQSVIEGEAEVYEALALFDVYGFDRDDIRWEDALEAWRAARTRVAMTDTSPVYDASFDFVYAFGATRMREALETGGRDAIEAIVANPPNATYTVSHDIEPTSLRPDARLSELEVPQLVDGYTPTTIDRFGWWIFVAWCGRAFLDAQDVAVCDSVTDDVFSVVEASGSDEIIAIWRVRLASPEDAAHLVALEHASSYGVELTPEGDVLIMASTTRDPEAVRALITGWQPSDLAVRENQAPSAIVP